MVEAFAIAVIVFIAFSYIVALPLFIGWLLFEWPEPGGGRPEDTGSPEEAAVE